MNQSHQTRASTSSTPSSPCSPNSIGTSSGTAADTERRTLLDEFLTRLDVFPDHLDVEIRGAERLNVALHEVGLGNRSVETVGVGGPTRTVI